MNTNPEVRCSELIAGRDSGGCCGVSVVGIDIGQESTHHCWHTRTHVLRRQTREVTRDTHKDIRDVREREKEE